jgi:hypothetical protein
VAHVRAQLAGTQASTNPIPIKVPLMRMIG